MKRGDEKIMNEQPKPDSEQESTREEELLSLLTEALEVIERDELHDHFTDDWRARAEVLVYPPDADETGPTEQEVAEVWPFVAPPVNDQVN
jgi:hypothetical protein